MRIIDFQLHEPAPWGDWQDAGIDLRRRVQTEMLLQSLDDMGVDGAVLYPQEDEEWACDLARTMPARFAVVTGLNFGSPATGIDVGSPTLEEDIRGARSRGIVGLRHGIAAPFISDEKAARFTGVECDRALRLCELYRVPLFVFATGRLDALERPARMFPELQLVVDHIGMAQPPFQEPGPAPWSGLDDLVRLAALPNIAIKLCGAPSLSAGAWPYDDVWPHVSRVIDAFGPERVAWASDIQRFRGRIGNAIRHAIGEGHYPGKHNYMQSLAFILYNPDLSTETRRLFWAAPRRGSWDGAWKRTEVHRVFRCCRASSVSGLSP